MGLSVEDLCGLLTRSRLVTSEDVHSLYDRWLESAADKTSTTQFTRWLVRENLLTEYQAMLLAKGMVDDFFLGGYKILGRLGRGRMAGVYKAQHADGRIVAIKVLPPSRTKIPALMARFQREAKLALTFQHANVVRSLDFGETKGVYFLVMELLDGENLDEVLARRKRLPPAEAARVVYQTLLGLQHLHEHGVVHRDLKPANLMVCPPVKPGEKDTVLGRVVKILDIGLARKAFEDQTPAEKVDPTDVTQEGVLLGTPDYMSPDQARDPRAIDIRSDIYSLGCVLYHLIAGQTPFPDTNVLNLMIRHATETPKPLREFVPTFPDPLQAIVSRMTAKAADQRYATPAQAAEALRAFLEAGEADTVSIEAPLPSLSAMTPPPPAPKPRANDKASSGDRMPSPKAPKKSGNFAIAARPAPVGRPHLPPPRVEIELVPLESPADNSPLADLGEFGDEIDVQSVISPRPARSNASGSWVILGVVLGLTLVALSGILIAMMRGRE